MIGLVACGDDHPSPASATTSRDMPPAGPTASTNPSGTFTTVTMTEAERSKGFKLVGIEPLKKEEFTLSPGDVYLRCEFEKVKSVRYFIVSEDKFNSLTKKGDKYIFTFSEDIPGYFRGLVNRKLELYCSVLIQG